MVWGTLPNFHIFATPAYQKGQAWLSSWCACNTDVSSGHILHLRQSATQGMQLLYSATPSSIQLMLLPALLSGPLLTQNCSPVLIAYLSLTSVICVVHEPMRHGCLLERCMISDGCQNFGVSYEGPKWYLVEDTERVQSPLGQYECIYGL